MRRPAFSLAEVVVSAALLSMVVTVCVMVFVPALRVWSRGQARSQVQQEAMVTEDWVRRDVEHAAPESIYWENQVLRMVVQGRPLEFDGTGQLLWHESVCYWLSQDGQLHRQAASLDPPPAAVPVVPAPSPDPTSRVVARDVYAFDCQLPQAGLVRLHLEIAQGAQRYQLDATSSTVVRPAAAPSASP